MNKAEENVSSLYADDLALMKPYSKRIVLVTVLVTASQDEDKSLLIPSW